MDLVRAFKIYNFNNINELNISEIRKRYRVLLKNNHPDNVNRVDISIDEIKEAKRDLESLLEFKCKLEKIAFARRQIFIDIDTLIKLYRDKSAVCYGEALTRSDIKNDNTYLVINYSYRENDGRIESDARYVKYNINDDYSIDIDVPVASKESYINLSIGTINQNVSAELKGRVIYFKFDYNITVKVNLRFIYGVQ